MAAERWCAASKGKLMERLGEREERPLRILPSRTHAHDEARSGFEVEAGCEVISGRIEHASVRAKGRRLHDPRQRADRQGVSLCQRLDRVLRGKRGLPHLGGSLDLHLEEARGVAQQDRQRPLAHAPDAGGRRALRAL